MAKRRKAPPPASDEAMTGILAPSRLMTDIDAPSATTANGKNPWPWIMLERAEAGDSVAPEWQEAIAEASRRKDGKTRLPEIW